MSEIVDILSPAYIGADRFVLTVDPVSKPSLALNRVIIMIDYSAAEPEGIELPIEVIVQPPSEDGTGYIRKVFRKFAPSSFTFTPIHAGQHLILVKEVGHNRWQGRLLVEVEGDEASEVSTVDRI